MITPSRMIMAMLLTLTASPAWANPLPPDLYHGYWAMTKPFVGQYMVIDFHKTNDQILSTQYRFNCLNTEVFEPLETTQSTLVPTATGYLVYEIGHDKPLSEIQILQVLPNEGLILQQTFSQEMPALQSLFPDGMVFAYAHTPEPIPLCDTE